MKVLFAAPQAVSVLSGGLRRQILETASGLEELGFKIEYLSPNKQIHSIQADLIHLFGAHAETYFLLNHLKSIDIPKILSPVFFSRRSGSMLHLLLRFQDILSKTPLLSLSELQMRKRACELATHLLPNTKMEAKLLTDAFHVSQSKMTVIPNGADTQRFKTSTLENFHSRFPYREFILYVGDLTAERKNVGRLIHAYQSLLERNSTLPDLVLAGELGDSPYANKIRAEIEAHRNIHWIGPIAHEDPLLGSLYRAASIFILPSYFETPGIAALEAALAGSQIVITPYGGTKEVFQDSAIYIEPGSSHSIASGLEQAIHLIHSSETIDRQERLIERITTYFDWKAVASQTADIYRSLL